MLEYHWLDYGGLLLVLYFALEPWTVSLEKVTFVVNKLYCSIGNLVFFFTNVFSIRKRYGVEWSGKEEIAEPEEE